jgi:hypothetical protein
LDFAHSIDFHFTNSVGYTPLAPQYMRDWMGDVVKEKVFLNKNHGKIKKKEKCSTK